MNRLTSLAFAAVLFMGLLAMIAGRLVVPGQQVAEKTEVRGAPKSHFAKDAETIPDPTVIHRDSSGRFTLDAKVNGNDTRFLVDTGADVVVLTVATAQNSGVPVDTASFQPIVQTASGEGKGARYTVQELEVAGHNFRNVDVVVVEGLETNLLGQTLLTKLGGVSVQGDSMVLGKTE
jgi:aspartyl protease family protein